MTTKTQKTWVVKYDTTWGGTFETEVWAASRGQAIDAVIELRGARNIGNILAVKRVK